MNANQLFDKYFNDPQSLTKREKEAMIALCNKDIQQAQANPSQLNVLESEQAKQIKAEVLGSMRKSA